MKKQHFLFIALAFSANSLNASMGKPIAGTDNGSFGDNLVGKVIKEFLIEPEKQIEDGSSPDQLTLSIKLNSQERKVKSIVFDIENSNAVLIRLELDKQTVDIPIIVDKNFSSLSTDKKKILIEELVTQRLVEQQKLMKFMGSNRASGEEKTIECGAPPATMEVKILTGEELLDRIEY